MTPQTFSLGMCRLLSSLAPKFEGHYWWVVAWDKTNKVVCSQEDYYQRICPAWQVEDVLRNLKEIFKDKSRFFSFPVSKRVVRFLRNSSDITTAYQKIEEYLWTILKQPKGEECTKAHCKCIQTDCLNHHYVDDK